MDFDWEDHFSDFAVLTHAFSKTVGEAGRSMLILFTWLAVDFSYWLWHLYLSQPPENEPYDSNGNLKECIIRKKRKEVQGLLKSSLKFTQQNHYIGQRKISLAQIQGIEQDIYRARYFAIEL